MLSRMPSGLRLLRSRAEPIVIIECTVTALVPAGDAPLDAHRQPVLLPSSSSPKQNE